MLLSQFLSRGSCQLVQPTLALRITRCKGPVQCFQALRWNHISAKPVVKQAGKNPAFPERLLVFHAGTGRSVFLGCLKVTTIFIFSFFCLVGAPAHFYSEDQPKWVAAGVMLSGIIPMVFVAYISAPFVAHIHLRLPSFARHSRDMIMRYSQNLPKDASVEITTMNFIGKPRVSHVKVADLYPAKERFGMVNYVRDTKDINSKRPWWMGRAARIFGVHGGVPVRQGSGVWDNIARAIAQKEKRKRKLVP